MYMYNLVIYVCIYMCVCIYICIYIAHSISTQTKLVVHTLSKNKWLVASLAENAGTMPYLKL